MVRNGMNNVTSIKFRSFEKSITELKPTFIKTPNLIEVYFYTYIYFEVPFGQKNNPATNRGIFFTINEHEFFQNFQSQRAPQKFWIVGRGHRNGIATISKFSRIFL